MRMNAIAAIIHAVSAVSIFEVSANAGVAKTKHVTQIAAANRAAARGNLSMVPAAQKTLLRLACAAAVTW